MKKIRRLEGFKNPEDIWDLETYDEIKSKIEKVSPNVREFVQEHELDSETKRCLDKTRAFCSELSEEFRQVFLSLLEQYRNERRQISQKIIDYLLEKKFDLPNFTIAHGEKVQELLKEYDLDVEVNGQNLLLVFQLPKPLAQFWWKGGADSWGDMSEDVEDDIIEWGHFYRELMPVVWEEQGRYENENGLDFSRVNGVGEHDPKKYYYIWEMSEWEN
ncbi:hypothetical protein ISS03_01485 [Patescibacteria group bacterium]|nr:hypothetical protein [Patescibacteria group bacterium]